MSATMARFSSGVVRRAWCTCRRSDLATRQTTGVCASRRASTCGSAAARAPALRVAPKATSCACRSGSSVRARAKNSVSLGSAPGQPPSTNPTPSSSSSRATASLSATENDMPSPWAPSRSVVSKTWNESSGTGFSLQTKDPPRMREVCALAVLLAGALGDNHHREVLHVAKSRHSRGIPGNPSHMLGAARHVRSDTAGSRGAGRGQAGAGGRPARGRRGRPVLPRRVRARARSPARWSPRPIPPGERRPRRSPSRRAGRPPGTGTEQLVEAALANLSAHAAAGPDPLAAAGSPEAARLDQVIRDAAVTAWIPDGDRAGGVPPRARSGRRSARRQARPAVRRAVRLGRLDDAVAAARAAMVAFPGQGEVDDGVLAYAALTVAQTAVDEARPEEAYRAATESLAAFRRGAPLPPVCVPDQVAALAVQAEAAPGQRAAPGGGPRPLAGRRPAPHDPGAGAAGGQHAGRLGARRSSAPGCRRPFGVWVDAPW